MTLRYLLDTNVLSEPVRPKPNPTVMAKLRAHQEEIATATVVLTFHGISETPSKTGFPPKAYFQ